MATTRVRKFDSLRVNTAGQITVAWHIQWFEDEELDHSIGRQETYDVEDDVSHLPNIIQDVAAAVWTPGVISRRLDDINAILVRRGLQPEATLAAAKAAYASINQGD